MLKSECIETISEILQLLLADFFSYLDMFDFKGKEFSVNTVFQELWANIS